MKKLINHPENAVREMLEGLVAIYPGLALLSDHNVIVRADAEAVREGHVAIISGGGSGHEPAHAGYVGPGMLSAAVAGQIFSSPPPDAILAGIRAVARTLGALLIVKNYTGDRLNFSLAAEMARAEGIPVEVVIVADDVALAGTQQYAGARGIAGTVLVHKIAGAAAAEGKSLSEVAAIAQSAASAIATMGVALTAGTLPGSGKRTFDLADNELEFGLGIHGEPGVKRAPLRAADVLAEEIVASILSARPLQIGAPIAVLVNNLGSTTPMELAIFTRAALTSLTSRKLSIERVYAGTFMTSLDAAGVSLTLARLDEDRLRWLDAPTSAPAWPSNTDKAYAPWELRKVESRPTVKPMGEVPDTATPGKMRRVVGAACRSIENAEERLTKLDHATGDGDLGTNLARGAKAVLQGLAGTRSPNPADMLTWIAWTLQNVVGGSSGALYGVMLLRAANSLRGQGEVDSEAWAIACVEACKAISEVGDAQEGDRTMLDALQPFATNFAAGLKRGEAFSQILEAAVCAAEAGAERTANMLPRRGRSSYLGDRVIGHPDPGAMAVTIWLRAVASEIRT